MLPLSLSKCYQPTFRCLLCDRLCSQSASSDRKGHEYSLRRMSGRTNLHHTHISLDAHINCENRMTMAETAKSLKQRRRGWSLFVREDRQEKQVFDRVVSATTGRSSCCPAVHPIPRASQYTSDRCSESNDNRFAKSLSFSSALIPLLESNAVCNFRQVLALKSHLTLDTTIDRRKDMGK